MPNKKGYFENPSRPSSIRRTQIDHSQVPDLFDFSYLDDESMLITKIKENAVLQSPDYEEGVSGWRIGPDSIEIDNGVFRGELQAASGTFEGGVFITDDLGRDIKISGDDGMLALSADNEIIHDLPSASVGNNNYLGHLVVFDESSDNVLRNIKPANKETWYTCDVVSGGNTNIKGVMFKAAVATFPTTGQTIANTAIFARPFGSGWIASTLGGVPESGSGITLSGATAIQHIVRASLSVPVDSSGRFQVGFFSEFPTLTDDTQLIVVQLGVYI